MATEVTSYLPECIAALQAAQKEAEALILLETVERAKSLAPVDSGQLRDSIHAENNEVVASAEYAAEVELGSSHQAPHPFLTPAANSVPSEEIAASILNKHLIA